MLWTRPEGLPYDADRPLPPLGGFMGTGKGQFYAAFADGSVKPKFFVGASPGAFEISP